MLAVFVAAGTFCAAQTDSLSLQEVVVTGTRNATVNYALSKNVGLWLRGENLLAQSYEINLGYPMPRATFMGGVNINF